LEKTKNDRKQVRQKLGEWGKTYLAESNRKRRTKNPKKTVVEEKGVANETAGFGTSFQTKKNNKCEERGKPNKKNIPTQPQPRNATYKT